MRASWRSAEDQNCGSAEALRLVARPCGPVSACHWLAALITARSRQLRQALVAQALGPLRRKASPFPGWHRPSNLPASSKAPAKAQRAPPPSIGGSVPSSSSRSAALRSCVAASSKRRSVRAGCP